MFTECSEERGKVAAAQVLAETGKPVVFHKLDVTDKDDCASLASFIRSEYGHLDILVSALKVVCSTHVVSKAQFISKGLFHPP